MESKQEAIIIGSGIASDEYYQSLTIDDLKKMNLKTLIQISKDNHISYSKKNKKQLIECIFDDLNRCDCCVKGWKRNNEFGLCSCYCDDCHDRYGICMGRVSTCNKYKNHILIYDKPLTNPLFHHYIIKHFFNRIQSKNNN